MNKDSDEQYFWLFTLLHLHIVSYFYVQSAISELLPNNVEYVDLH